MVENDQISPPGQTPATDSEVVVSPDDSSPLDTETQDSTQPDDRDESENTTEDTEKPDTQTT